MKIHAVLLSSVIALTTASGASRAGELLDRPVAAPAAPAATTLTARSLAIPSALEAQINAAIAACGCFTSVTAWQVSPIGTPAQVFGSPDLLFAILGLDVQLPWVAAGEINAGALATRLTPSGQAGLVGQISAFADPSGHGFHLGAYAWSHPTQPDFCSGETLYLQYFPHTGVLFAFRFDTSHEC